MRVGILHTAFIGDVILSGLLVEALSAAGHEIIYFTKKNTCAIFSSDTRIKKVIAIDKGAGIKKLFAPKKIAAQIAIEQLDVLLVPHRSMTSTLSAYLAKVGVDSKVKVTIGFENASLSFLYKKTVRFQKDAHECVRYLALLNSIVPQSILDAHLKLARPILRYSEEAYSAFNSKFASHVFKQSYSQITVSDAEYAHVKFSEVKENFFILAVGSVWKTKKYLVEHWVDVVYQFLTKHPNFYCVLTGSQADAADIEEFISLFIKKTSSYEDMPSHGSTLSSRGSTAGSINNLIINAANLFSLFEFGLFTSYAKFVLSNDSSPVHFASAFNIPVLTIFGPTIPEFGFAPTSTNNVIISYADEKGDRLPCQPCSIHGKNVCPQGHFKCMKELSPQTVVKGIEKLL